MEQLLLDILAQIRAGGQLSEQRLERIIKLANKREGANRKYAKKHLLPFYQRVKAEEPERWASWNITPDEEAILLRALQMKPRRTASGVATITVITKPWPCASNCHYCPNDIRMPKSYIANEPACQRAERNYFDPYLQVARRLQALTGMGHITDKIELIVLGGTWADYPTHYQRWFMLGLFAALNASDEERAAEALRRAELYAQAGIAHDEDELANQVADLQKRVDVGVYTYNQAVRDHYGNGSPWEAVHAWQTASEAELEEAQRINETSEHRVVGLVIETRPDTITPASLRAIRSQGATKIQMGIQSISQRILDANNRTIRVERIAEALALTRLFGFKSHIHVMTNLLGATPESDAEEFRTIATAPEWQPDEIKLYPCALIAGTQLARIYDAGGWRPYSEDELLELLTHDVLATPPFTRISRMIRDFSSDDIVAGNKKANLRQMVEARVAETGKPVQEIRYREIARSDPDATELRLDEVHYETTVSNEVFLQWVTPQNRIAGFLRLSLPKAQALKQWPNLPISAGEAMIREVHVYGKVAALDAQGAGGAQHRGLGKQLIARAEKLARAAGYTHLNVISSVGTREYYRALGFTDADLYQQKALR